MGHHTTTSKSRTKRPDSRPNEKRRRKQHVKDAAAESIQDLRVTRKQKHERKERTAVMSTLRDTAQVKEEKYVKALRKKLREIDALIARQKKGDVLDDQQLAKIESLDAVMQEMETVLARSAGGGGGDDVDDDDDEEEE